MVQAESLFYNAFFIGLTLPPSFSDNNKKCGQKINTFFYASMETTCLFFNIARYEYNRNI